MKKAKITGIWIIGLIITLSAAVYQRVTGPTYPYKTTVNLGEQSYELEFIRSGSTSEDAEIDLEIPDEQITATLNYKLYPTDEPFKSVDFTRTGSKLSATLPAQPMAGKLLYFVEFRNGDSEVNISPQIIRFKGDVPDYVLVPHVLFMFLTMFLSNVSGLLAAFNFRQFKKVGFITFWSLLLGGMILGPVVQKYAFNEFWAGIPFAWDLTDNKTLIAFIFWLIAFLVNRKQPSRTWTIVAAIVTMIIFAIPHSMFGSELDPETGKIIQGAIFLKFGF